MYNNTSYYARVFFKFVCLYGLGQDRYFFFFFIKKGKQDSNG